MFALRKRKNEIICSPVMKRLVFSDSLWQWSEKKTVTEACQMDVTFPNGRTIGSLGFPPQEQSLFR